MTQLTDPGRHSYVPFVDLRATEGTLAVPDYGRVDLPRDLATGASVAIHPALVSSDEPGDYRVELDIVRDGVAWFSSREPSSAVVALTVA